jgi:hypothetical protein
LTSLPVLLSARSGDNAHRQSAVWLTAEPWALVHSDRLPAIALGTPVADRQFLAGEDDLAVGQIFIEDDAGADAGVDADLDAGHEEDIDAGAAVVAQIAGVRALKRDSPNGERTWPVFENDYQINGTGYWRKMASPLTRVAFSTRATATRRRSKGSRCTIGRCWRAVT